MMPSSLSRSNAGAAAQSRVVGRGLMLGVLCGAVVLVMASVLSLATALPDIAVRTGASQLQLTWIVNAYTVVLAGLLLPAGALGDRYGRRGTLVLGLVVFGAGCLLPVVVSSPGWLIASRMVAGFGAAFILPSTLSLITTLFPPSSRSKAVGLWAGAAAVGGAVGVMAAGLLLESFSFRSVFAVSAAAAGLLLIPARSLPTTRDPQGLSLDIIGALLSTAAVSLVVVGIIGGPEWGWASVGTVGCLVLGVLAAVGFVRHELHTEHPLLDVRLFGVRAFGGAALSIFVTFVVMFAFIYLSVQFLQYVRGDSALVAGLSLLPIAVTVLPTAVLAPTLAAFVGMRAVLLVGAGFTGGAVGLLTFLHSDGGYAPFGIAMLVLGLGLGLMMAPATDALVESVSSSKQGVASAVNDAAREVAAALGIAVASSLLSYGYRTHLDQAQVALPADVAEQARDSTAAALQIADRLGSAGAPLRQAARDAFTVGMHDSFIVMLVLFVVGAAASALWCPPTPLHERRASATIPAQAGSPPGVPPRDREAVHRLMPHRR